jgi:hypothetical protein
MGALKYEQVSAAERVIARLVIDAGSTYADVADSLPLVLDAPQNYEKRYISDLQDLGSSFAPTLAHASRFCEQMIGADKEVGAPLPPALRHLISLLEDVFVMFWSAASHDDIQRLQTVLPVQPDVGALFTPEVLTWIQERSPEPVTA